MLNDEVLKNIKFKKRTKKTIRVNLSNLQSKSLDWDNHVKENKTKVTKLYSKQIQWWKLKKNSWNRGNSTQRKLKKKKTTQFPNNIVLKDIFKKKKEKKTELLEG